jgi:hypothetical protein
MARKLTKSQAKRELRRMLRKAGAMTPRELAQYRAGQRSALCRAPRRVGVKVS